MFLDHITDGVDEKKIKVDMCKAYLREKGLRLTGTKSVLLERIKEHILLEQNNGPSKYPEETFSTNCQGMISPHLVERKKERKIY